MLTETTGATSATTGSSAVTGQWRKDARKSRAYCLGHNANSIGVCMVGGTKKNVRVPEDNFTEAQFASLAKLVRHLLVRYPGSTIHCHCEYAAKACPVFSLKAFLQKYGIYEMADSQHGGCHPSTGMVLPCRA